MESDGYLYFQFGKEYANLTAVCVGGVEAVVFNTFLLVL